MVCTPRAPLVEARTQGLHVVVARWVAAVTGFLGLEMLRSVGCGVVKHWPEDDAVVGSVVPVHSAQRRCRLRITNGTPSSGESRMMQSRNAQ